MTLLNDIVLINDSLDFMALFIYIFFFGILNYSVISDIHACEYAASDDSNLLVISVIMVYALTLQDTKYAP